MDIKEMHQTFRVYAQQVGMQNVRAILPESIDIFINDAIGQYVQQVVIRENSSSGGRVRTSHGYVNSKSSDQPISSLNALRTLYKTINLTIEKPSGEQSSMPYLNVPLLAQDVMFYTAFSISYGRNKYYDCRIIEPDELENTLNDYCNGASFDYPICSVYADVNGKNYLNIYADKNTNKISNLVIKYFEEPAKVCFGYVDRPKTDCNLPTYTHATIVRLAARLFRESIHSANNNITN